MIEGHKIGVASAIAYCVGDIVGSGIFVSPTSILKHTGSVGLSLIVWAIGALISLFGALCYLELGTTIRKSGNDFAYLSHFGWHPFAAAFLWVSFILSYPATMAIQTITLGQYIVAGFSSLFDFQPDSTYFLERLIGFSVLWPLLFLNFFSLKNAAGRFQVLATLAKILVSAIIIITGFYYLIFKGGSSNFSNSFSGTTHKAGDIVLGIYSGLFAYNGWDILNFGSEEIDNPKRTLPIAAFAGIGISAVLYILMNIAYFSVLTVQQFEDSEAVAVTFAAKTLGDFQYAVPFLIAFLLTGSLNSTIFGCSRYLFAGASRGVVPSAVRCVHRKSASPRVAVVVEVIIAICISFLGNLDDIISYMSFALWTQRTMTQIGFIYWKYTGRLSSQDAFTVPLIIPCIFLCICIALLIIPIWQDFYVAIYGLSLIILGFVVYFLFIYPKELPSIFYRANESVLVWMQVIFNAVPVPLVRDENPEELSDICPLFEPETYKLKL